jgi:hypothetical protein
MLHALLSLAAALTFSPSAHAGPTLGADLDLGTSVDSLKPPEMGVDRPPALYDVGFRIRAGWRFDLGFFFLVPEVGAGYDVERAPLLGMSISNSNAELVRALAGARAGWSFPLLPALRIEPAIYGHVGYARYTSPSEVPDGLANDVGLALDFRFLKYFTVGAHLGYDVVTTWRAPASSPGPTSGCVQTTSGCLPVASGSPPGSTAVGDGWLAYGLQAGAVFW